MSTQLKPLGFYQECDELSWNGSIHQSISSTAHHEEDKILAYLRQGFVILATTHIARDVFSPEGVPICAPHLLTDGVWIWPRTLIYYIEKYHCRLPEEFLIYLRSQNWRFPERDTINGDALELPRK